MCKRRENEVLIMGNTRRNGRTHDNLVEVSFAKDKVYIYFYQKFFETWGNIIGKNDYIRLFADMSGKYIRIDAQPLKGQGSYKLCKRQNCHEDARQVVLPRALVPMFSLVAGRRVPELSEQERSIVLSFE